MKPSPCRNTMMKSLRNRLDLSSVALVALGPIAIQLMKQVLNYHVVATASRPESESFARKFDADSVINDKRPLAPQLRDAVNGRSDHVLNTGNPVEILEDAVGAMNAFGGIVKRVSSHVLNRTNPADVSALFRKRQAFNLRVRVPAGGDGGLGQARQGVILDKKTATAGGGREDQASGHEGHGLLEGVAGGARDGGEA
eukprot:jgi/Chlat1/5277/Chrsp35S00396